VAEERRKRTHERGVVLDAGAFIALEKPSGYVARLLARLLRANVPLATSGGVVAQVWRGGSGKHTPVGMLLPQVEVLALDRVKGKLVGMLLGVAGAADPVDGHVVLIARERRWPVLTSDENDLRAIDPNVVIVRV
jgi:hypothetical protein